MSNTTVPIAMIHPIFREVLRQIIGDLPESCVGPEDITVSHDPDKKKLTVTLCTRNPYIREALSRVKP